MQQGAALTLWARPLAAVMDVKATAGCRTGKKQPRAQEHRRCVLVALFNHLNRQSRANLPLTVT